MKIYALQVLCCLSLGIFALHAATSKSVQTFSYPSAAGNPNLRVQYIWTANNQWTVYWKDSSGTMHVKTGLDGGTAWSYMTGAIPLPE